jgi:hypothetical protein
MKTYILKKRKDRRSIRDWFGTVTTQSPTYYRKTRVGSASARSSAHCKCNDLLAVGRQWQD